MESGPEHDKFSENEFIKVYVFKQFGHERLKSKT